MSNEIEIVITGKDAGASKVMTETRKASDKMGEGFDAAGERADTSEQRILGLKDTIDGTAAIMKGPGADGIGAYVQGWADLAGGIANFVIPAVKAMTKAVITAALEHVKAAATTVAAWIRMAIQATLNAARMAAAWLVAMGPVGWAIGVLVALGAAFAVLWRTSERFRDIVRGALAAVLEWIRANWPYLLGALAGPFGLAAAFIFRHWNQVIGFFQGLPGRLAAAGRGMWTWIAEAFKGAINTIIGWWNNLDFTAPKVHIPGTNIDVGGFTIGLPDIPYLRSGGIVRARPGGTLAVLGEGGRDEMVVPLGAGGAGQTVAVRLVLDSAGSRLDDALVEIIRKAVANRGGDVQSALGRAW